MKKGIRLVRPQGFFTMELAGLEPATSWVRCGMPFRVSDPDFGCAERNLRLARFMRGQADSRGLPRIDVDSGTGAHSIAAGYGWAMSQENVEIVRRASKNPYGEELSAASA